MSFTKFVSMLAHGGLHFSALDQLGDSFEGSLPRLNVGRRPLAPPRALGEPDRRRWRQQAGRARVGDMVRRIRRSAFASTWHLSEHESAAMWKLYGTTHEAIALRSTYAKLRRALPRDVHLGLIRYIDYEHDALPLRDWLEPFVYKRKSFEHEREVRALVIDWRAGLSQRVTPLSDGVWRRMKLDQLIEQVSVAPTAPDWFRDVVSATTRAFGYRFPIRRSKLDEDPLW
jgi:hypothetical protein